MTHVPRRNRLDKRNKKGDKNKKKYKQTENRLEARIARDEAKLAQLREERERREAGRNVPHVRTRGVPKTVSYSEPERRRLIDVPCARMTTFCDAAASQCQLSHGR